MPPSKHRYDRTYSAEDHLGNVLCELECRIHYSFTPGTPERGRSGPPELYDPGSAPEVFVEKVEVDLCGNGQWADCRAVMDTMDAQSLEDWADMLDDKLIEHAGREIAAWCDMAEEARAEARAERLAEDRREGRL